MNNVKWKWAASALVLLFIEAQSLYAPEGPVNFEKGQTIDVEAAKMISSVTQLPYEYYSLPFCLPKNGTLSYKSENLGEILRGDTIVKTAYEVEMALNISCKLLCHESTEPMTWEKSYSSLVIERIQQAYIVYLLMDNLIGASLLKKNGKTLIIPGYYLGGIDEKNRVYINNYLKLKLAYHRHGENEFRVVGFNIEALSVDYNQVGYDSGTCNIQPQATPQYVNPNGTKILFFYSVEWKESNISWASRWDTYLTKEFVYYRWLSIMYSTIILIVLSVTASLIMHVLLSNNIKRYNPGDSDSLVKLEAGIEEIGWWNLVYADVFRPPTNSCFFTAVIGSGIQVFFMTLTTVLFDMLGMISSARRGAIETWAIYSFVFSGLIAGYFSARLYKTMQGERWKKTAFLTATLYPGIVFGTYFSLSFLFREKHSSGAVPFAIIIFLLSIWLGISLPLVYLGYFFGYRKQHFTHPVTTKQKLGKIPDQSWYLNTAMCLAIGTVPSAAVLFDLFSITNALWNNDFYNFSGFLFIVFIYVVIYCSEISIIMVYILLRKKDSRWWWKSFMVSGGSALYIQTYIIYYFFTESNITEIGPTLIYFGYMGLITITFWLLTGTISFFAAYFFIRKIYANVKLE